MSGTLKSNLLVTTTAAETTVNQIIKLSLHSNNLLVTGVVLFFINKHDLM